MQSFGDWLRSARTAADLSQGRLAAGVQALEPNTYVYQSRIADWEHGRSLPTLRQLVLMARVLRLAEADLQVGRDLRDQAELADLAPPSPEQVALEDAPTVV